MPDPVVVTSRGQRARRLHVETLKVLKGVSFISPWIIGFIAFTIYPLLASLYYSFTDFSLFGSPRLIGLANYSHLFADPKFTKSMANTVVFLLAIVPASIIVALLLAILVNNDIRGNAIYRTVIYMPSVVPAVAAAMVWMWILNPQWGLLNAGLRIIGVQGPPWLSSPRWTKPSLLLITLWTIGSDMILYLAGLQDIPIDYYEAASLDGASALQKVFRITIPLITPIMFFHLINAFIWAFNYFTTPYIISGGTGQPADSLLFYSLYLYQNAFSYLKMGYASAMAWLLFVLVLICTVVILKTSKGWVHYGD
ncbi:MAG: sugar ABC transporter permease [Anaerolineales bacterium]